MEIWSLPSNEEYMLLQLSHEQLKQLKEESHYTIMGPDHEGKAFIVSSDKTYQLKAAYTSNSLHLLNIEESVGTFHPKCMNAFWELSILKRSEYVLNSEVPFWKNETLEGISLEALSQKCIISQKEVLSILENGDFPYIETPQGKWLQFEQDFIFSTLEFLLTFLQTREYFTYEQIPLVSLFKWIQPEENQEFKDFYILFAFVKYFSKTNLTNDKLKLFEAAETSTDDNTFDLKVDLDMNKIARFLGKVLLKNAYQVPVGDFLNEWQNLFNRFTMIQDFTLSTDLLLGIGTIIGDFNPMIQYCPIEKCPTDIISKFTHLFKIKPMWAHQEMRTYFSEVEDKEWRTLCIKHTRLIKKGKETFYQKRH